MQEQNSIPISKVARATTFIKTGAKVGGNYLRHYGKKMFDGDLDKQDLHKDNAEDIYNALSKLKGSALKVAQMASMERNFLPEAYQDKFSLAQYNAPPLSYPLVVKTFRKTLGKGPEEIFETFSKKAVNAASIGQVHKATKGSKTLAVKIQYPGVADSISADLRLVKPVALRILNLSETEAREFLMEVESKLKEETDYDLELLQSKELTSKSSHLDGAEIIAEIVASGLRGRGGAGYPAGLKIKSCADQAEAEKFVVCNADEGDPGSYSDKFLLEENPHLVLFGMAAIGKAIGSEIGVIYIRGEYPASVRSMNKAVEEFRKQMGDNFRFVIMEGAGSYVAGEETALLSAIEGQRPEVRLRPPYPTEKGLFQKPTVVINVETVSCLHHILTKGANSFADLGIPACTGPKLICLDSYFNNPGIFEVEMGTSLEFVINNCGSGFRKPVKALHIGGPMGGVVPASEFASMKMDFESFMERGYILGHASIVSIPADFPMIEYLHHLFKFTADESCGKCFPCSLGSVRGQELIEYSISGDSKIDSQLFDDLLNTLELGSLCGLGKGLTVPVRNVVQHFSKELESYFESNR